MVQLLINSNVLFHPAAKRVELTIFPDQSEALLRCDSACKQRGTKLSAEGAERVPSQSALENPAVVSEPKNESTCERTELCLWTLME